MTALAQIRNILFNLRQPGCPCDRDDIVRSLEGVEAALVREMGERTGERGLSRVKLDVLAAMAALGGAGTPAQIGQRVDPKLRGAQAGALVTMHIAALRTAGFIRKVHYGWWEITEAGRAQVPVIEGRPE